MAARLRLPKWPTLNLERELGGTVCGVDEAGYAPLAGPVVAAAVIIPPGAKPRTLRGLTDSKLLTAEQREEYAARIRRIAVTGVGAATVAEIDELNIYHANLLAMRRAVEALGVAPEAALVDGRATPALACPVKTVVKGDRRSLSVAAASVLAKVARDRIMHDLEAEFPGYGWKTNVGYGTDEHYLGLLRRGPTIHHRLSFAPLNTLFADGGARVARFRFEPAAAAGDPAALEMLELRQDLHAVFDARGLHLGQLKNVRGRWTFQSVGYGGEGQPLAGEGPCAGAHGRKVAEPARAEVIRLLSSVLS